VGALARQGEAGLATLELQLFQPIQPMLADSAVDVEEAPSRLGEGAALEYKLDAPPHPRAGRSCHVGNDPCRLFTGPTWRRSGDPSWCHHDGRFQRSGVLPPRRACAARAPR
jgi:hypothetical protein